MMPTFCGHDGHGKTTASRMDTVPQGNIGPYLEEVVWHTSPHDTLNRRIERSQHQVLLLVGEYVDAKFPSLKARH
ncbi:hypothetical protein XA68_11981 [Ophiocordyceps unilateralis]|uniref:Uncharacterized protein n=1 Tax=Ophiocordyceps unilateralis TaxID=268505 RepID=A0A2A9PN14_OPHUN|nr:hypothetical protein XA68_11981 [Ophiocordyceps unilateralis]